MGIKKFFSFGENQFESEEITLSDKKEINEESCVITNSRGVLDYTVNKLQTAAFRDKKKIITQSCGKELTNFFGKHNTTFKGSEYNHKVWIVNFAGCTFEIFTSPGYGTQVVVDLTLEEVQSGKHDNMLKAFSDKLYNIINK